jgi:hypothetical protein
VIILKKVLALVLLFFVSAFIASLNCKAQQTSDALNNNTITSDKAIKDGNIVMISYFDKLSNISHNDMEIYNFSRLDEFMENIKKGKKDKIRIVKYESSASGTWVNKLYDLKYDGKKIVDIEYDAYSNPNVFIPSQPLVFNKIIKRDYSDGIWYGICYSEKGKEECASLISFRKSSIVDIKE